MFSISSLQLAAAVAVVAACTHAPGNDSADTVRFVPMKSSRWQDRASEYVQKHEKLTLNDGSKTVAPSGLGYVYVMERAEGGKVSLTNRTHSLHGWVPATDVVRLDDAERYFSREIEANARSPFPYIMRAVVRRENDDLDHALADADEALRVDPKNAKAWTLRAMLRQCKNRLDPAMADVNKAIELDPNFAPAFVERGFLSLISKQLDESRQDLERARALGSRSIEIELISGAIDLERGDPEKAEAKFNHVLTVNPDRVDVRCILAGMHAKYAGPEKALTALNEAIQIDPRSPFPYRARAQIFFFSLFEYDKALADLNEAIKLDPTWTELYLNRVAIWFLHADFDRALADLEKVTGIDASDADAQIARAWLLAACPVARLRNGPDAVVVATRACELTGWKDPETLGVLAAARSETGDFNEAAHWQMKAIGYLDPDDPEQKGYRDILQCYQAKKSYHAVGKFMEMGTRSNAMRP